MSTPDNWQDDTPDESLAQQTQQLGLNSQASQFTPQATAQTFTPPQYYQQYGAYDQNQYQNPNQQYNQRQGQHNYGYNQQYGGQQAFQQYGQGYNQSSYGQNWRQQQQQQQNYGYQQQQQQNYDYQQQSGQPRRPVQIAKKPTTNESASPKPPPTTSTKADASGAAAPKAKVLSITGDTAPKQAKTLSIGADGGAKVETAGKTKVLTIGSTTPTKESDPTGQKPTKESAGNTAPEAGLKAVAAKAIEKTGEAVAKVTKPGTESPTHSSGRDSPSRNEKDEKAATLAAESIAKEQEEVMDAETLRELYGKEHVNVIFLGHVDHGKSTLGGSILYSLGMVDERTMEKLKREAKEAGNPDWFLSWALDTNKEERAEGKTVEVGRASFETEKRRYSILDAPGHKLYISSMIGGASQADVGILVTSARGAECTQGLTGQTEEHAILIKSQGINKLIVAVNKMDDRDWSQDEFERVKAEMIDHLCNKKKIYQPKDLTFIPVAGLQTMGIKDRVPKDLAPWYDGPSLLECLDNMEYLARKVNAPLMMPITAKYRDLGTMIEGKIEAGVITKSDTYLMMPNKETVTISALYGESEEELQQAICGDQVRIRIRGVEEEDVQAGFVLCSPKRPVHTVSAVEAKVTLRDTVNGIVPLGFSGRMHIHSSAVDFTLDGILNYYAVNWSNEKVVGLKLKKGEKPPRILKFDENIMKRHGKQRNKLVALKKKFSSEGKEVTPQDIKALGLEKIIYTYKASVRLQLKEKICVERYEDYPQLGRFTLRTIDSETIAVGNITRLITDEEA